MVVGKNKPGKASSDNKLAETVFEEFAQANNAVAILVGFQKLKAAVGAENLENGKDLYPLLKSKLQTWKCKSLWEVLDARAKHKEYGNRTVCEEIQVLVIGAGPIGLRTAIEAALLGAKVVVVEKRTTFGRNNVLHLWPFLIQDFRSLGAKRFYGKFCSGCLDHISIRVLQCMLMKTALIMGVQIYTGVTFEKMIEPVGDSGWKCQVNPPFHPASQLEFDMVVAADGKKNVLPDFPQIEMRGSLAIGITLNLVYHCTKEEAAIAEVSGLAYHFKPQFFDELYQKSGVRLENLVYYKNETHYFVMTAVKSSLLARGVLVTDYPKAVDLLAPQNVNQDKLVEYALDAVKFGTNGELTNMEFVINDRGKPDIAVFDFTSLKKAEHAARIVERKGHRLLMALVGDSLIEPFWPTGSGCARGVLSALDTAWMLRAFALDRPPLQVLSERESVYKLLSATTVNNLRKKFDAYTINPITRYIDLNLKRVKEVYHLYDSDDPVNADFRMGSPTGVGSILENTRRRLSVTTMPRIGKIRQKSSSEDLDEKKDPKGGNKKKKLALRRSGSRDLDVALNEIHSGGKSKSSKSKKVLKKLRSRQSSESADEKDVHPRRQRGLGRTKSRDTDGSNNSLDTITESPKAGAKAKNKGTENADNSLVMKQRSTKRWRLFSVSKPKRPSLEKEESLDKEGAETKDDTAATKKRGIEKKKETRRSKKEAKKGAKEEHSKKESENKEIAKKNEAEKEKKGALENAKKGAKKGGENQTTKTETTTTQAQPNAKSVVPRGGLVVKETVARTNQRQLESQDDVSNMIRSARSSLRKPNEVRRAQATEPRGFTRSVSDNAAVSSKAASDATATQLKRANSEVKRKEGGLFSSLRRSKHEKGGAVESKEVVPASETVPLGKEVTSTPQQVGKRERKRSRVESTKSKESASVFDDMKSLSPAARRTVPLLETLTPEKKDGKYGNGGALSAVAGIAAMVALTMPLAMEEQDALKEFQMKRQKILSSNQGNVKEKIALLNSAGNSRKFRRDLATDLDNADGSPKPVKRFFSFSAVAQRNVKPKLEDKSPKLNTSRRTTLPSIAPKDGGRRSFQGKMGPTLTDIPTALDSAIDILVKQYNFREIQDTFKILLNIFRCISKGPEDESCRRVCTQVYPFRSLVWDIKEAKLFMIVSGWMEIGSFILFPKSENANEAIRVLMQNYRMLSGKQDLDTTYPQLLPPEHCRASGDAFRASAPPLRLTSSGAQQPLGNGYEPAKDDGKDTGSHSSDSGMGFSETASGNNVAAVMSAKATRDDVIVCEDDVFGDDVAATEVNRRKRAKIEEKQAVAFRPLAGGAMDPKRYLEDSYDGKNLGTCYVGNEVFPAVKEAGARSPAGAKSLAGKKHDWEMVDPRTFETPRSPEKVLYDPFPRGSDQGRNKKEPRERISSRGSGFLGTKELSSTLDALLASFDEPMEEEEEDDVTRDNDKRTENTASNPSDLGTSTEVRRDQEHRTGSSSKSSETDVLPSGSGRGTRGAARARNNGRKMNEVDDLFDTLDFVSEAWEPPRVVYNEKPVDKPKQARRAPRATEASRRREQFIRSKSRAVATEEKPSPRPKRRAQKETEKKTGNAPAKTRENPPPNDETAGQTYPGSDGSAEETRQVRRSRRIAEMSGNVGGGGRKAILTLGGGGGDSVGESSTDLNVAFVNSNSRETTDAHRTENGTGKHDSPKTKRKAKKVRRQSSTVKTNKSRGARAKRVGLRMRKDRSIDE